LLAEAEVNRRLAHWSHGKQLALGSLLFGLGFGSLVLFRAMPLLALSSMIWTFGEMVFLPASSEAVAALAPTDRRGEYLGLYSLAYTAALALGAWLGLTVYAKAGPPWVWVGCGVLGAGSAFLMVLRKKG
jgi:predicted MFS family arabinose efflux permease